MSSCLKQFFCNSACDVRHGGLTLKLPNSTLITIWFDYGMALQDGAAHKLIYCIKGDSGCRFCCLCLNAWSSVSEVLGEDGSPLMICTMCKISDMKPATDADLLQAVDRLAHRKATITEANIFKRWQKASGLVHQPNGLLLDPSLRAANVLRPVSQYCHDPMHTLVANGVLNVVMWLVLVALGHHLDIWGSLYSYVKLWSNPLRFKAGNLHEIFSRKREKSCKDAKKFKCMASDLMSVYPILCVFFRVYCNGEIALARLSLLRF